MPTMFKSETIIVIVNSALVLFYRPFRYLGNAIIQPVTVFDILCRENGGLGSC